MSTRQWFVYALQDPRNDEIRYVGWTFDCDRRLKAHIAGRGRGNLHRGRWIDGLLRQDLLPRMIVLEVGTGDWQQSERHWIAYYRGLGARLVNLTDGGDGSPGYIPSPETRARMSEAHRGRRKSPESIAKTAAGLRGRKQQPEHIEKLAKARKGKIPVAATLAAAQTVKGSRQRPEHIEKRIAPLRGRVRFDQRVANRQVDGQDYWQCNACLEWKGTDAFVQCKSAWNGIKGKCKKCHADYQRELRRKTR